jgi:hypothetical protein
MSNLSSTSLQEGLQEYRGRDLLIFLLVKFTPVILMILLFVYVITAITVLIISKEGRNILGSINAYGNLIISVLTLFLVLITGFYARVTNRILAQMIEEKQSSVRPILWVTLENPEFHESENLPDDRKFFKAKARIANYGKAAAVEIQANYTIPYEWEEGDKFVNRISTSRAHPALLTSGNSVEDLLSVSTKILDFEFLYPDYLRVSVLYEDTERNLYELEQSYYLLYFHTEPKRHYLNLESESLHFITFKHRTRVTADDECRNSNKKTRVFRRKKELYVSKPKAKPNAQS